ncbi:hypothetical protein [Luteibacter yeojuensis]|uniref:Uncharacterized protein n=1 Tax=Luteibacter yeojuensis TaxID=345309 RepID=A0A0F3KRG5_9GAMM|nr:hypothetical protein [Luteibacter yeojuensis]KJV33813.1 hypothetical protein VI08_10655 [Luteibacter yeojuensis]
MDSFYTIDVDVQLVPGRGYSASYVITEPDGTVVHRRLIARRFAAYSEAMSCALDVAKATAATLPKQALGGLVPHGLAAAAVGSPIAG